ncbi:MAG: DUF655 domain-containing protein, partial [Anaerococcus vaginalis]|nr:DUF655 domain-containing protein [Anaerococcus vaginalis]
MPEEHEKWRNQLIRFAKSVGKPDPEEYIDGGNWKARQGGNGVKYSEKTFVKFKPCADEAEAINYELKKEITEELYEFFKPFGWVNKDMGNNRLGEVYIVDKNNNPILRLQGRIGSKNLKISIIKLPFKCRSLKEAKSKVDCQITKYQMCLGCLACESVCKHDAVKVKKAAHENEIVFGLSAIKNVGENLIDLIVNLRKEKEFKSFKDFLERIEANDPTVLNKKALESLIKAGVFDCMGYKRSELMAVHETALQSIHDNEKVNLKGQMNLLDLNQNKEEIIDDIKFPPVNEYKNKQKLKLEKEVLGFYISDHPLNSLGNNLKNYVNFTTEILSELRPV